MHRARGLVAASCVVAFALVSVACSETKDDSGATTNLDEVGPQIAKLRLEVQQLRQEVRTLREELALLTPATDPGTGAPTDGSSTTITTASPLG